MIPTGPVGTARLELRAAQQADSGARVLSTCSSGTLPLVS